MDNQIARISIDINKLDHGTVISEEELHKAHEASESTQRFEFWVLALRQWIWNESAKAGRPLVVRQKGGALHILYDAEASEYIAGLFETAIGAAAKCRDKMSAVDIAELNAEERARHDRRQYCMDSQISTLDKARNHLGLAAASQALTAQLRENIELPSITLDKRNEAI